MELSTIVYASGTSYHLYAYILLIFGALFIAGVGVMSISFFLDDYWADEDYRITLRMGKKRSRAK